MSLDKLKSLISEAFNSFGTQNEKNAINNASSYIDNLDSYLSKLADLDYDIKVGKIDSTLGLELFILEIWFI